jgi:hypothetical protein
MRKWASYLIPVGALIVFVFIMQGGCYFISSQADKDAIPQYIDQIRIDLKTDRWDNAREDLNHLDLAWEKVIPRIQFHAEMDAIDGIKEDIARLNGSIDAEDPGLSLAELAELSEHWENLKN